MRNAWRTLAMDPRSSIFMEATMSRRNSEASFFLMMGHICWMILGDMIYFIFHVLLGDIGFHHVSPNSVTKYPSTKVEQPACAKSP
jgi:hypothetical protein